MEIKVPSVGESVFEALVGKWHRKHGDEVRRDEPVCEIETDKITMELNAEADGILSITVPEGTTVKIGTVIGVIEEKAGTRDSGLGAGISGTSESVELPKEAPPLLPAARKLAQEQGLDPSAVQGTGRGGRVTVEDLLGNKAAAGKKPEQPPLFAPPVTPAPVAPPSASVAPTSASVAPQPATVPPPSQPVRQEEPASTGSPQRVTRTPMTPIRKRIAERLLAARQQTAMLTTFAEADMARIVELRKRHKEQFQKRHGVSLGFMSFFVKACVEALKEFPLVNASIDGDDIVQHHYYDIGIAIGGEKGLVVPVIRDADRLHFWEIERAIEVFVEKVKTNRLELSDFQGGTFTISNGGVYGSLLSTPILNPPQSGVLGMHAIQERAVVRDGQIVIRPMMYLALSYDHRIIDGREAVQFLKKLREYVEEPEELFLEG